MSKRAVIIAILVLLPAAAAFAAEPGGEAKDPGAAPGGSTSATGGAAEGANPPANAEAGKDVDEAISSLDAPTVLPEVLVTTPTRGPTSIFEVPRPVTLIPRDTIREYQPRQVMEVITRRDPGIVMDQRTSSTGDPIMRGFAGFNILTLVDGNTLSTLWGEGGDGADDMYGKVDTDTIERIEIVRGPNSVLYGSGALGGVINIVTRKSPIDYVESGGAWGGRVKAVYESNMKGFRGRTELYGATKNLKFLAGVTHARQGDARSGSGGKTLDPTSGRETNWDFRTDCLVADGNELTFTAVNVYRSHQHRYYRPTQDNKAQRWALGLAWNADELAGFMSPFQWRVFYQVKRDQRRDWSDKPYHGKARTVTWSTDMQASSDPWPDHHLTYGIHAQADLGESPDDEQFTITQPAPERAAAPDSTWSNYGVYLQDEWEVLEDLLTLTGSVRYDYFTFKTHKTDTYVPTLADGTPIDTSPDYMSDSIDSLTGGVSLTVKPDEHWRALASYSRGFRQWAPYFGLGQLGKGVRIPNGLLDPVTSNNYEVGFRTRYPEFTLEGFLYYSDLQNFQETRGTTYNGEEWIDWDGDGIRGKNEGFVQAQTVGGAYVWGFELKGTLALGPLTGERFLDNFSMWGGFAWNRGKIDGGEYLRHTQPARGILALRWDDPDPERAAYVEFVTEMVNRFHRIPSDRLPWGDDADLAYLREPQPGNGPDSNAALRDYGGVPGFTVFSLYSGINACSNCRLTLAVENIGNKKFRRAHSRMDAFGLNIIFGAEVTF